jgi:hypothetical protein
MMGTRQYLEKCPQLTLNCREFSLLSFLLSRGKEAV